MPCLEGSGSHAEGPANSSSLLFSWTGVNSFIHLAFDGLPKSIFAFFMEGNTVHRNLFHASVIKPVALAQEVRARLRIRNHGDHSIRRAHNPFEPQRVPRQTQFPRGQIPRT